MKSDQVYLQHILEAIEHIEGYLEDLSYADFMSRVLHQDAVVRRIEIIGEATSKLSQTFRKENPELLPYTLMIAMRNKLIHEYFGLDLDVIWRTCQSELPKIKKIIQEFQ